MEAVTTDWTGEFCEAVDAKTKEKVRNRDGRRGNYSFFMVLARSVSSHIIAACDRPNYRSVLF